MIDEEILETAATVTRQNKENIRKQVEVFRKTGQLYIYGKTRPYWIKTSDSFTTSSGDYQINLRNEFPDFMRLRFMWTTHHKITPWTDDSFRRDFPDDTATGEPNKYFPLDNDNIQLHPRADGIYTVYTSYYYKPAFDTIGDTPEEWHHVVLHYVLMMYDPATWKDMFYDSLKDFVNEAKFSEEADTEILPDKLNYDIKYVSDNLRR